MSEEKQMMICPKASECPQPDIITAICRHKGKHDKDVDCACPKGYITENKGCPACVPYKPDEKKHYPSMPLAGDDATGKPLVPGTAGYPVSKFKEPEMTIVEMIAKLICIHCLKLLNIRYHYQ